MYIQNRLPDTSLLLESNIDNYNDSPQACETLMLSVPKDLGYNPHSSKLSPGLVSVEGQVEEVTSKFRAELSHFSLAAVMPLEVCDTGGCTYSVVPYSTEVLPPTLLQG